jgi:hypothetical protein
LGAVFDSGKNGEQVRGDGTMAVWRQTKRQGNLLLSFAGGFIFIFSDGFIAHFWFHFNF